MKTYFLILFKKHRRLAAVSVSLLVFRLIQGLYLVRIQPPLTWLENYLASTGTNVAAFLLIPLAGIAWIRPMSMVAGPHFAIGSGCRLRAAARAWAFALLFGLLCSCACNMTALLTALPLVPDGGELACLIASAILQTLVFAIALMIATVISLATGKSSLAFLGLLVYGVWDFMAATVVGGGVPSLGWGTVIIFPDQLTIIALASQGAKYGTLLLLLLAIHLIAFERRDYVSGGAIADQA